MAHPYPWSSAIPAMNAFFPRRSMGSVVLDAIALDAGDDRDDEKRRAEEEGRATRATPAEETPRRELERRRACADIIVL